MAQMQVFVSHNHKDTAFCQALVKGLRDAGADVWYDEHNMGSGRLGPTIERELRRRTVFVVVLSPDALQSQWVEDETRWAYGLYRKDPARIIQPVTARVIKEDDVWLFLQDFRRIEASGYRPYSTGEAIRRLLHALALTSTNEIPMPMPPQPSESDDDLVERGSGLIAQQRYAEAIPPLERATELDPRSAHAWTILGSALDGVERSEEALAAFDQALALDPNYELAWNNKGAALNHLERFEEALVAFDQALAIDPYYHIAWSNKGFAFNALQRFEEALVAFDQALDLDSDFISAWFNKGEALENLKRYSEALAAYDRAFDRNDPVDWQAHARVYRALGRTAEAEAAERRARELGG